MWWESLQLTSDVFTATILLDLCSTARIRAGLCTDPFECCDVCCFVFGIVINSTALEGLHSMVVSCAGLLAMVHHRIVVETEGGPTAMAFVLFFTGKDFLSALTACIETIAEILIRGGPVAEAQLGKSGERVC